MSELNDRDEARVLIKKITDFNISNEYYVKEKKEEIVRDLRKLLFIDDTTVRKFLEKWINVTKEVARDFDLMGTEVEVNNAEEEKTPEEEGIEKDQSEEVEAEEEQSNEESSTEKTTTEDQVETPTEETAPPLPENYVRESYIKRASELVIDLLEG